ncbi:MAG: hypothetical protein WEB09_01145 [Nitriliruptor sp.]
MARVTVHHLTPARNLPLIEEDGLRTRADLSGTLGPVGAFDQAAPGTYANGKRVSGWLSLEHARTTVAEHGPGHISYSVDPRKTLAAPASLRTSGDAASYWEAARPLAEWQADGDVPDDLEVHTNVPVRAKYLQLHAPLVSEDDLGDYAPLVAAVADEDRLSAKALMHLAVIASDGDFDSPDFVAACAMAWRDEPDREDLVRELMETDPDKVASAALAEHGATAPEVTGKLRHVLDETREWADSQGIDHGRGLFARTAAVLDEL